MSRLSRLKDAALEKALLLFLRPRLKRYGELSHVTLNTSEKVFTAEINLLGDSTPLTISRARYRIEKDDSHDVLVIYDVKLSKEWAQNLIEDHFDEARLKVPDSLRPLFKRLL